MTCTTSTGGTSLPVRASLGLSALVAIVGCDAPGPAADRDTAVQALTAGKPGEAAAAFEQACAADDGAACDALGTLLAEGRGVPADRPRAEAMHRTACDLGAGAGCANLGALLAGQDRDVEAAELFRRACMAGVVAGCSNLGVMYGLGRGVDQDPVRAAFLANWACDGGDALACTRASR